MKLVIVLMTICLSQMYATGVSQSVTFTAKEAPLEKAFEAVKAQTGIAFFYDASVVNAFKNVSISANELPLKTFLSQLFHNQNLDYAVHKKTIVVTKKGNAKPSFPTGTMEIESAVFAVNPIRGVVIGPDGRPLAGASVNIKGEKKSAVTNINGAFEIDGAPGSKLVITFIGYETKEITAKLDNGSIVLDLKPHDLDQVVVQAYGTTTQRLQTGNIATVTAEVIERQPVMNIMQALQSMVPGLTITQTSGAATAPFKMELRGRSTINDEVPIEPMVMIDGIPLNILEVATSGGNYANGSRGLTQGGIQSPIGGYSALYGLNPSDIESISVLKDADALAIYGSRGANGVILITTKKGKSGKTRYEATVRNAMSMATRRFELLNTEQYLELRREAYKNSNRTPGVNDAYDLLVWDQERYTDWQHYMASKPASVQEYQITTSGGTENSTFRIAGNYKHMSTVNSFTGADQRASLQFNMGHTSSNKRFSLNFSGSNSYSISDQIPLGGGVVLPPNAPAVFDENGLLNYIGWEPGASKFAFGNLLQPYKSKTFFLNNQIQLRYKITQDLEFVNSAGFNLSNMDQVYVKPIASLNPKTNNLKGSSQLGVNNNNSINIEPQLHYNKTFGDHSITALLGGTYMSTSQQGIAISSDGYSNDKLIYSISNAEATTVSNSVGQFRYVAAFTRLNYNYKDKYVVNLSARRDGSSRFGPGKQFGNFGAIGATWLIDQENWFKSEIISYAKVRASYGLTGSDGISDYKFLSRWKREDDYQLGEPSYYPTQLGNPDLQWQEDRKLEFGANIGLLNNKYLLGISVYQNRIANQLVRYSLPITTGFSEVTTNFPAEVQNRGIEVTLSATVIKQKEWRWTMDFNIGKNDNKLLSFPDIETSPYAFTYEVGKSLNIRRLLQFKGVDPQTGRYTYEDLNKDGLIVSPNGRDPRADFITVNGSMKYAGGFRTGVSYKNFTINIGLDFRRQSSPNLFGIMGGAQLGSANNLPTAVLDRWRNVGDTNVRFARPTITPDVSYTNLAYSDAVYTEMYFVRLNNAALSYNITDQWIKKAGFQNINIMLSGQNLFHISNMEGLNPETPRVAMGPLTTISLGIRAAF